MLEERLNPRFNETDALGHINNNVYTIWFDFVRIPILKIFDENINAKNMPFILAHTSTNFLNEVFYGKEVIIKTALEKVGNSSMHFIHAVYQNNRLCTTGKAVMVHFDHKNKGSMSIPKNIKEQLQTHILNGTWKENL